MEIKITRLKVVCCHGALDFEKTAPQPFYVTALLQGDFFEAAENDDLNSTVNYAAVCDLLEKTAKANCFNLIERLAGECAFCVLENFQAVKRVQITVEKPQAPVEQEVENLSVTLSMERETSYLSVGSSMGDKKAFLDFAIDRLASRRGIKVLAVSDYIATAPYGGVAQNEFLNCAVKIETFLPPEKLLSELHKIEGEAGRTRQRHWDDRTLDIDIIFYGKKIILQDDLVVPHPDYFNRDFVLQPLKQIAGDFICPVKKVKINNL